MAFSCPFDRVLKIAILRTYVDHNEKGGERESLLTRLQTEENESNEN